MTKVVRYYCNTCGKEAQMDGNVFYGGELSIAVSQDNGKHICIACVVEILNHIKETFDEIWKERDQSAVFGGQQ